MSSHIAPGDDVIQVVMIKAIQPAFEQWLQLRNAYLFRMPADAQGEDDMPTYGIGVNDEAFRRVAAAHDATRDD